MKRRMRTSAGLILLAALALAAAAPAQQQQSQEQSQQQPPAPAQPTQEENAAVQAIYQTNDPEQRLALIQDFLAKYPESSLRVHAYRAAAEAYRRQNKYAQVVEYGDKAIELSEGRDAFTYLIVADALAESSMPTQPDFKENSAKAEAYARRGLEGLPELFAQMPRREGIPEEEYTRQQRRYEALGHAILGNVYFRRQENARAVEELTAAVTTQGYIPDAVDLQRLGMAHFRLQQYKEAEAALQRCMEMGGITGADCQKRLDQVREAAAAPKDKPKP